MNSYRRFLPFLLFVLAASWLLWPSIWSGNIPAFRDTLHFYYPLWSFIDSGQAGSPWLPLWNRYDAFGSSVIGEATSTIFYPPRAILLIDALAIGQRIGLFLLLHLLLANIWMYRFARYLKLSRFQANLAATCYALSGPVAFQIYNPVFLVGAAWLPMAFHMSWKLFRDGSPRAALGLSISLAMMILGGDAQAAYHFVLVGSLLVAYQFLANAVIVARNRIGNHRRKRRAWYRSLLRYRVLNAAVLSATAVVLAVALSAVQILPTIEWVSQSNRLNPSGYFDSQRFQFSVSLSDWLSAIVPNIKGGYVPFHTRWAAAFEPNSRTWVPSLHFGSLAVALFLLHLPFSVERSFRRLRIVFLIAALSAIGDQGFGADGLVSLQSLWAKLLPFYSEFRYPAKWLSFAILAATLLAAQAVGHRRFTVSTLRIVCGIIATCAAVTLVWSFAMASTGVPSSVPADPMCGPFEPLRAQRLLFWSSLATLMSSVSWGCMASQLRQSAATDALAWPSIGCLSLVLLDITLGSASSMAFVAPSCLQSEVAEADRLPNAPSQTTALELPSPAGMAASDWLCCIAQQQTAASVGKLHLLTPYTNPHAQFSFLPRAVEAFRDRTDQQDWLDARLTDDVQLHWTTPTTCRIQVKAQGKRDIVLPIFATRGWRAYQETKQGKMKKMPVGVREDLLLVVQVDSQTREFELRYWPRGLTLGLAISTAALFAWLISFSVTSWQPK